MISQSKAESETKEKMRVEGSTSMSQMLHDWAKSYTEERPTTHVEVVANGTPLGLKAILERRADVAMASRKISAGEMAQFADKGIKLVESNVGLEGVTLIVNKGNPIKELSLEQLKCILTGECATWDKLGGPQEPITFMLRKPSKSGTSTFVREQVLGGADFSKNAKFMDYYDWVAREVAETPWAFGILAFSFADEGKVKILPLKKDEKSSAATPSHKTFTDGSYPLTRPFFLYTRESAPKNVVEFVEYCKGKSCAQQ